MTISEAVQLQKMQYIGAELLGHVSHKPIRVVITMGIPKVAKIMKLALFASLTVAMLSWTAQANEKMPTPFGVEMGSDIKSYPSCSPGRKIGMYQCKTLPRPHNSFDSYIIQYHNSVGVCWVKGVGKERSTNGYGTSLISEFEAVRDQIAITYGPGEFKDSLLPKALWNERDEFMMSLYKEERYYSHQWNKTGKSLKGNVENVYLGLSSSGNSKGYVIVEFAFTNEKDCEKAIALDNSKAF